MRLVVIGSSGFIGSALVRHLRRHHTVTGIDRRNGVTTHLRMDAGRASIVNTLVKLRPDAVIHAAAEKRLTACEEEVRHFESNVASVAYSAKASQLCRAQLLFISSDMVFGGGQGQYVESAPPCPVNQYGRWKCLGEQITLAQPDAAVIRTAMVFGMLTRTTGERLTVSPLNQSHFPQFIERQARRGLLTEVARNIVSCPTPLAWLCDGIATVLKTRAPGVFHLVSQTPISRSDLAREICSVLALDASFLRAVLVEPGLRPESLVLNADWTLRRLRIEPLHQPEIRDFLQRALRPETARNVPTRSTSRTPRVRPR